MYTTADRIEDLVHGARFLLAELATRVRAAVREHTVERVRKAVYVATFPLVTDRANQPALWRACARVAWKGLRSPHADALNYFVAMRRHVERGRAMATLARNYHEAQAMCTPAGKVAARG
jgi:hypothetical protein